MCATDAFHEGRLRTLSHGCLAVLLRGWMLPDGPRVHAPTSLCSFNILAPGFLCTFQAGYHFDAILHKLCSIPKRTVRKDMLADVLEQAPWDLTENKTEQSKKAVCSYSLLTLVGDTMYCPNVFTIEEKKIQKSLKSHKVFATPHACSNCNFTNDFRITRSQATCYVKK